MKKRPKLMAFLRWLLMVIVSIPVVIYITYAVVFYRQQRNLLFQGKNRPIQISDPSQFEGLVMARFDTPLGPGAGFAWYLKPPTNSEPAPAVIIGHGNGEIADDWVGNAALLRDRGYGILILGYPGYGHAPGSPSKDSIIPASIAAYDWFVEQPEIDPTKILVFGHSVGGAPTLAIADQRPTQGAVLLSTFASIDHVARDRYLPGFLAKDRFDNVTVLENYDRPVFIMQGTEDLTVFPYQAEILHEAAAKSRLRWLPCGHGGCIGDMNEFWIEIDLIMQGMLEENNG